eukprot:10999307-Heterocapsa_arctica.AAC.1
MAWSQQLRNARRITQRLEGNFTTQLPNAMLYNQTVNSQCATQSSCSDNAGFQNAARSLATRPPKRNLQRRNHQRHCSQTALGNAEPQRRQ